MKLAQSKSGFTLLELVMVIAVLAIIASIGIGKFGDLRLKSAKKVNLSNLQALTRAAQTYIAQADQTTGIFDKMEALLDVSEAGRWLGTAGQYEWTALNSMSAVPGIYRGPKRVSQISNAAGEGPSTTEQTLDEQRKNNQGLPTAFANKLAVYYLKEADVTGLKNAGISSYLLHNFLAGQSSLFGFTENEDGTSLENGGPGFRADMSAFYKVSLTNGSPVVVLKPTQSKAIYKAFGCDLNLTKLQDAYSDETLVNENLLSYRLFCFGLGRTSTFARNALDTVPRCELFGRDYYRNYILVFKQPTSAQSGGAVTFAGVLDSNGDPIDDARFKVDWR
jgi:prepilin-type N-terminal cleavage/methylation domain-containing protein